METRLHGLERQNRFLILLLLAIVGIGSIAATNHTGEIRTSHLIIVDNHGKVLEETQGINGQIVIKRYAGAQETNE
jgi:hypothetical protein